MECRRNAQVVKRAGADRKAGGKQVDRNLAEVRASNCLLHFLDFSERANVAIRQGTRRHGKAAKKQERRRIAREATGVQRRPKQDTDQVIVQRR
ncbi:hypothetical protein ERJ75_000173900 [Trypanosoma vivax]|nr:hypothetical protein ERJ75_000173900 [Trypanosoma vivax]